MERFEEQLPTALCCLGNLEVGVLLHLASCMVHRMWRRGEVGGIIRLTKLFGISAPQDPDNAAIPYLTALGDLLGGAFLAAVFHTLHTPGTPGGP